MTFMLLNVITFFQRPHCPPCPHHGNMAPRTRTCTIIMTRSLWTKKEGTTKARCLLIAFPKEIRGERIWKFRCLHPELCGSLLKSMKSKTLLGHFPFKLPWLLEKVISAASLLHEPPGFLTVYIQLPKKSTLKSAFLGLLGGSVG